MVNMTEAGAVERGVELVLKICTGPLQQVIVTCCTCGV